LRLRAVVKLSQQTVFCGGFDMRAVLFSVVLGVFLAMAHDAHAQAAPTTEQMIEQLQKPRTRSFRNLTVEAVPKPSLSLQIQFDFDSSVIKTESKEALMNLATALNSKELEGAKFAVEGHTDAKGNAAYNQKLSASRAAAVKAFLAGQQVAGARLVASGKGSSDLAKPDEPLAAENRRVRIVNLE
jgi:outer membrane protein OmpA-like peptidoglycan-associated protein